VAQPRPRHLFPGANTPQGFYSRYDQIAPADATKVFILKGGPGTGKSTFMRKLAADLTDRGIVVEYHHCSADPDSLDAIYLPDSQIAVMDGTAPHVIDPRHPGAVDVIINLGAYWDEGALRSPETRAAILRLSREYRFRYQRAYDALRAAHHYLEEWKAYYTACLHTGALNKETESLLAEIPPLSTGKPGQARRLFASAVAWCGPRHWLQDLFGDAARRYVITGEPGTGKSTLVGRVAETALARGYTVDIYHCPMYPERVDHLYIRETGTAVITSTWPHLYTPAPEDRIIDTNPFVDLSRLAAYQEEIEGARSGFVAAMEREIAHLRKAKQLHDELEQLYIPHIDFAAIEQVRQRTLQEILSLISGPHPATAPPPSPPGG